MFTGCNDHFITDRNYRLKVERDFRTKKAAFADTALFAVFAEPMSLPEREAITFLYAYMPPGDVADYDGGFYLRNIRSSFQTREEMQWDVPEMLFRHFVLPVRVNNENLDESRMVFHEELKDRVRGLSMADAALEVNHWCHQKAVYTPTDGRTSSPLALVRTASGRCGEESTFVVAALRSVGIPARQVYTPRWAHTDDNHAWVEVYVEGRWQFMGACEPEPTLNLAWFNSAAYRGMLMHTKAFGYYEGTEEVVEQTACYTEINVIDNYAPVGKGLVTVKSSDGTTVEDATVEFKIYNYAEFYTVARKHTDKQGTCSLSAGRGDMLVWATKDGLYGFGKLSFANDESITVILDRKQGVDEFDITPPPAANTASSAPANDACEAGASQLPAAEASKAQQEEHGRRIRQEDSIRNAYTATFYTEAKALEKWDAEVARLLTKSCGNYAQIEQTLSETPDSLHDRTIALLTAVSNKDLRDTPASTFFDHIYNTTQSSASSAFFNQYVLNPRVSNELITPYKGYFAGEIDNSLKESWRKEPHKLVEWVRDNIKVCDELNPQRIPMRPSGVWKARAADSHSRDIFFVSLARSLDIPAGIEPVTRKVQYHDVSVWTDVEFDRTEVEASAQGTLIVSYKPTPTLDNPKYYSHFTIAKLQPDATLQTLNFEATAQTDMGDGDTWRGLMSKPLSIDAGDYLLVSGMRMASGKVLARTAFFTVKQGELTETELVVRNDEDDVRILGSIDAEKTFIKEDDGSRSSLLDVVGRGYFVAGILGARQEPTNHALRDIALFRDEFEQWGRGIVLLFTSKQELELYERNEFTGLPSTITYGTDDDGEIAGMLREAMKLSDERSLPIFVIADTFGRVVFVSQGYTIGLGEQMLKVIRRIEN